MSVNIYKDKFLQIDIDENSERLNICIKNYKSRMKDKIILQKMKKIIEEIEKYNPTSIQIDLSEINYPIDVSLQQKIGRLFMKIDKEKLPHIDVVMPNETISKMSVMQTFELIEKAINLQLSYT